MDQEKERPKNSLGAQENQAQPAEPLAQRRQLSLQTLHDRTIITDGSQVICSCRSHETAKAVFPALQKAYEAGYRSAIAEYTTHPKEPGDKVITLSDIVRVVSDVTGIKIASVPSYRKIRRVTSARRAVAKLARQYQCASYADIANALHMKDRSSAVTASKANDPAADIICAKAARKLARIAQARQ